MPRLLLLIVVLLLAVMGAALFLLESPDRFKAQIATLIETETGYRVRIDGELAWRYWPPIAIEAAEVKVGRAEEPPFAAFRQLEIDVDLIPLLTGQRALDIEAIRLVGGDLELRVDERGIGNWALPGAASTGDEGGEDTDRPGPAIEALAIEQVRLAYSDDRTDSGYEIILDNLHTTRPAADAPFDVSLAFTSENDARALAVRATGQVQYADKGEVIAFSHVMAEADLRLDEHRYPPINIEADGEWRGGRQALVLNEAGLQISTMRLATTGLVNLDGAEPRFDGVLDVETADAAALSEALRVELPFQALRLQADAAVTTAAVDLENLVGQFDQSNFKGRLSVRSGTPAGVVADLRLDKLDSTAWRKSDTADDGEAPGQAADRELLPVKLLRDTHLNAIVRVDDFTHDSLGLTGVKIETNNNGKRLETIANASGYGGKLVLSFNSRLHTPVQSNVQLSLDNLDVTALTGFEGISGALTGTSTLTFQGSTMGELSDSLTGRSSFSVSKGHLDVRPVKSMALVIDTLRGGRSAISDWPDIMPFDHLVGEHGFHKGLRTGQVLNAELENISITALGGMDPIEETLDYDVTILFKEAGEGQFKVSEQLAGIRWPMTCKGGFTDTPAELCLGKEGAISRLIAEAMKQELQRRGKEKLEDVIKDKLSDDLFEKLFK